MNFLQALILFFTTLGISLHAEIEDYFKKMGDKSGSHKIRNVDFIYMINLDERPEKFEITCNRFKPYNINPCRFSAVNGWKLPLETINDVGVRYGPWYDEAVWGRYHPGEKWATHYPMNGRGLPQHEPIQVTGRNYFCHCMSRGAIGIVLSHLSVLQDAYDSGYETIWVMEDDVEILRDPHLISDLIEELDDFLGNGNWDILFTDKDTKNKLGQYVPCTGFAWRPNFFPPDPGRFAERTVVHPHFRKIGARFGAYSMIIRRCGIKKILDFFKNYQIFLPIDIDYSQPPDIRLYTVLDDIVSPWCDAPTDNGGPNYANIP